MKFETKKVILFGVGDTMKWLLSHHDIKDRIIATDFRTHFLNLTINNVDILDISLIDNNESIIGLYISDKNNSDILLKYLRDNNISFPLLGEFDTHWFLYKSDKKADALKKASLLSYEVNFCIRDWLNELINSEINYWESRIPVIYSNNDIRFTKREFEYSYNSEIEFKNTDIVLDVGAGPVAKFGCLKNGLNMGYFPIDPLAYKYNQLLERLSIEVPVRTEFGMIEFLGMLYDRDYANYIIVNNALDHCMDPVRGIIECLKVLKIGGALLTEHHDSEGIYENYSGLHKWNITIDDDNNMVIFNEESYINISELLKEYADVYTKKMSGTVRDLIIVKIVKLRELDNDFILKFSKKLEGELIKEMFRRFSIV